MTGQRKHLYLFVTLAIVIASAVVSACGPTPAAPQATTAPPATQAPAPSSNIGTKDNPIQMYFVPSVDAAVIVDSGKKMADFLKQQTGLEFQVQVPTSYAATIEALGGCKGNCVAFIPALGYVLAHDKYGVTVGAAAVRTGLTYYFSEFLVARDSNIKSLEDLNGKKWAVPSKGSTSGYLFPLYMMNSKNIKPGEIVEAGGHPQAATAVYNGSVDFATVFFSPPDMPGGKVWTVNDPPEPPYPFKEKPFADEKNNIHVDGWVLKDARVLVFKTAPDILDKVRILTLSDKIPNDTLSFDKDFPKDVRDKIIDGLIAYSKDPEGQKVLSNSKFYAWNSIERVDDSFYDQVRGMIKILGLKDQDILK